MPSARRSIVALLSGIGILLVGNGLLSIELGLRAVQEGFSAGVAGTVIGGYFLGFIVGTFLCPRIIAAVGHVRAFAAFSALASVATLACGTWAEPLLWWVLRVIIGVAMVGLYTVVESWLNEQTPDRLRGRVFGIYMAVTLLALGLGSFIAPWAGDPAALHPFALASALFTLGLLPVTLTRMPQPAAIVLPRFELRRLFLWSPLGAGAALVSGLANGVFWSLGPVFLRGIGLDEGHTAFYNGLVIAGGALLQWPIGRLSDARDRRKVLIGVSLCSATAVLLLLPAMAASAFLLGVCAFVYGGLMLTVYSLGVSHMNDGLRSDQVLDATRGLLLLYGAGAALGPLAAGPAMEAFGTWMMPLTSAIPLVLLGGYGIYHLIRCPEAPAKARGAFVAMSRTSPAALDMDPRIPNPDHGRDFGKNAPPERPGPIE